MPATHDKKKVQIHFRHKTITNNEQFTENAVFKCELKLDVNTLITARENVRYYSVSI